MSKEDAIEVEASSGRERSGVPGEPGFGSLGCWSGSPLPKSRTE